MTDSARYYQCSRNTAVNKTDPELTGKLGKQTTDKFKMTNYDKCYEGNERGMTETGGKAGDSPM